MTDENATYDECGDIDAFVKKAVDKCAYVKKGSVDATVVDKSQEHDVFVANDKNKETFVKTDEIANVGGAEVKAPPSLAVQTAAAVSSYDLFVNEHPVESFYVDEENSLIVNQQDNVDVELDEDFTGNHAINEAFLVNKKTDKNPLIIDPKTIQTELLVSKKDVHEELFASKKSDELMINKEGIHDELFAGLKQEREDVGNKILDVKHKNRLHTLTGDVKDSAVSGVKQGVKNTGKRAVKETMLAPATLTDKMVRDTQGEDAQEALSVLTGTKIKDTAEQAKDYYNKAMSPFAAVGKVARAPRRVGEVRATVKEHRATRKVKSAERKIKSVDKNIAKYQKRELQGKAGYRKGASVFEKKNQKKLVKARRQAGRATAKFQKAKFIRAKKRPVAWLFDGRAKSAVIKVLIPAAAMLLMIMLIVGAISAAFGVFGNSKNNSGGGALEGNALVVYQVLSEKGYSDYAIAGVIGNYDSESGINPHRAQEDYNKYDENGNFVAHISFDLRQYTDRRNVPEYPDWLLDHKLFGYGLAQWTDPGRSHGLVNMAKSKNKSSGDLDLQCEYMIYECENSYQIVGPDSDFATKETSLYETTKLWYKEYEMSGNMGQEPSEATIKPRAERAQYFYDLMQQSKNDGEVNDGTLDETQKRIIEACKTTPSPGAGYCAMWVSDVYSNAGCGRPSGNANDMYWAYCHSSDKSELKPGMIIAVPSHTAADSWGVIYGHVGIYIGNGQVMDNIGSISTSSLDSWIAKYSTTYTVKWGWA